MWPVLEGIRPATGTRPPRFVILNHLVSDSLRWLSSSRSLSSSSELNDLCTFANFIGGEDALVNSGPDDVGNMLRGIFAHML